MTPSCHQKCSIKTNITPKPLPHSQRVLRALLLRLSVWLSVNMLVLINKVVLCYAPLVRGWVIVLGRVNNLGVQPVDKAWPSLCGYVQ